MGSVACCTSLPRLQPRPLTAGQRFRRQQPLTWPEVQQQRAGARVRCSAQPKRLLLPPPAAVASCEGVEDEGEEEEEQRGTADPENYRVQAEAKSKDLDSLLNEVDKGYINLQPRYQRGYVWSKEKASRLVESVFLKLFIPAVVLHNGSDGVADVVDGKQRLTTLQCFRKGRHPDGSVFKLQGMTLLGSLLNGKTYKDLPELGQFPSQRTFDQYTLFVTTFDEGTSGEAVLRVYANLNCGSESLTQQQIRRAVYDGPYTNLLGELAKGDTFQKMMGGKGMAASEKDQEFVLRFLALQRNGPKMFKGSMRRFLNQELKDRRHLSDSDAAQAKELFEATVKLVFEVYGENAFRQWTGAGFKKLLSPGLFDSLMQTFAVYAHRKNAEELKRIHVLKEQLREDLNSLCLEPNFTEMLKHFSSQRLTERLDMFQSRVQALLSTFSRTYEEREKLKQELFEGQRHECALCRNPITDLKEAELDHRVPLSKGGSDDPSNLQLAHRACNRTKGAKME